MKEIRFKNWLFVWPKTYYKRSHMVVKLDDGKISSLQNNIGKKIILNQEDISHYNKRGFNLEGLDIEYGIMYINQTIKTFYDRKYHQRITHNRKNRIGWIDGIWKYQLGKHPKNKKELTIITNTNKSIFDY